MKRRLWVLVVSLACALPACRAPEPPPPPPSGGDLYRGRLVFQFEGNIFYPCNSKGRWLRWYMPSMSYEQRQIWRRSLGLDPRCSAASPVPMSACDADVEVRGIVQRYGWSPDGRREVQTYRPDELHAALQQTPEGLQVMGQGPTLTIYQLNRVKRRLWEDCQIDY